jgi:phosphomevalonate kinase
MSVLARAPGKLVVLGEYAVLAGAPALVVAVDKYCRVSVRASGSGMCLLETLAPAARRYAFTPPENSGVPLVDLVLGAGGMPATPWRAVLDSRGLYDAEQKLGLGSSAAALCAWAVAWERFARSVGARPAEARLGRLIEWHRELQRGFGSGLDVAACLTGGAISYRLDAHGRPCVSSVRLPDGVGFAGIFAGRPAVTSALVARFGAWKKECPNQAARLLRLLTRTAEAGSAAAERGESEAFLAAVAEYGRHLEALGAAMGADIVTAEHLEIGREAKRHGVTYKTSGAGGGDLGIALSAEPLALEAFKQSMRRKNKYRVIDLQLDRHGVSIEERSE